MIDVSVIMGAYNIKKIDQLYYAVESILKQSYTNFEFIICDDGSTDNTYETLLDLKRKDSRIIIIKNKENRGLAYTLNHCLSISTGKYIARMDADDISLPNRLEQEVAFLDEHYDYAFVGSNVYLIDDNGRWGKRCYNEIIKKNDFLFNSPFTHPSVMIRKNILNSVNGYRVEKITRRAEDYDLWMRLYAAGYKGYNIQTCLLEFREDINTFSRRKYKYRLDEAMVRYRGFLMLGLMPKAFLYVIKPLIVGLIPQQVLAKLRKN